jgi:hypothetical protein
MAPVAVGDYRMMLRNVTAFALGVALVSLTALTGAQSGGETFKIRLTTVPIEFVEAPNVTGSGSATAVLTGDTVTINGTFEDLHGPATVAHVHRGRAKGVRGAVIGDLTVTKGTSGRISGTVKLTSAQIDALKSGAIYVQISSEAATEGNLWGWLLK